MRIVLAQINPVVGDIVGNATRLHQAWQEAAMHGAQLVIAPEMVLTGYPTDDLVLRPSFIEDVRHVVEGLAAATSDGPSLLLGAPWQDEGRLYNTALLLTGGKIVGKVFKRDLPNYGCFDDKRIFAEGPLGDLLDVNGVKIGVMICEDMWSAPVARHLRERGAQVLVVMNGSPYETEKLRERLAIARARVMENELPLVYVNLVGGQDELVFDGFSFVLDATGSLMVQGSGFVEDNIVSEWSVSARAVVPKSGRCEPTFEGPAARYRAMILGLQDYVRKNGFTDVVLGLSGGIDSALVAVLAADALGADHVHPVMLPSVYTSEESIEDAAEVAKALGCSLETLPIMGAVGAFESVLALPLGDGLSGLPHENIQARCRGVMLMAISNATNYLLLATGNKSELAVGYATLYGDMCGGYAPIKDLYKTEVYKVARHACGRNGPVIPERIFTKAPSAELHPNQKDQDLLPPYDELDEIFQGFIECDMSFAALIEQGHDLATVKRVWGLVQRGEYKRRQGPPGPKLTRRHLTKDRRYPITNGHTGS